MTHILGKLATIVLLGISAHASACTIENAKYAYSVDKSITVEFRNKGHQLDEWVSLLVLTLSLGKAKPTYWFLFDAGSARYTFLISTTDVDSPQWNPSPDSPNEHPLGSMEYFSWSSDHRVNENIPKPKDTAPTVIFLPDLPEKLFYAAKPRVSIAAGFFMLKSCSR